MEWRKCRHFEILAPGSSLRQRVAYSLAIVRLILVPVMFLAFYYLLEMGRIVDRIVNIDAPATQLAEQPFSWTAPSQDKSTISVALNARCWWPPGKHHIKVALPGYQAFDTDVDLLPNQKVTIKTDLAPGSITQAGPSIKKD